MVRIFETSVAKEYTYSSALVLTYFSRDARLRKKEKRAYYWHCTGKSCVHSDILMVIEFPAWGLIFLKNGWSKDKLQGVLNFWIYEKISSRRFEDTRRNNISEILWGETVRYSFTCFTFWHFFDKRRNLFHN